MTFLKNIYSEYTYLLPCVAALLTIFTIPPYHWPWLIFVSFAVLFLAIEQAKSALEATLYGLTYGLIFTVYVTVNVLSGFHWFAGAEIFVYVMYGVGSLVVVGVLALFGGIPYGMYLLRSWPVGLRIVATALMFAVTDWVTVMLLSGFNYGSVQFAVLSIDATASLLAYVPIEFLVFLVFLANSALAFCIVKKYFALIIVGVVLAVFILPIATQIPTELQPETTTVRVAVLQDQERDESLVFGNVVDGSFVADHLSGLIADAAKENPDIIVYPFNPWVGVLAADDDVTIFDRRVIAVHESQFTKWVATHVPADVVFVTWYTAYRQGSFYNEIGYWQNGLRIGTYQKQKLFPFFDYTPGWSQQLGVYTTPYDGSAGVSYAGPVIYQGSRFGNIICSEITNKSAVRHSAAAADILFSIGSEAMFSHELPAVFNYLHAKSYASQYQIPVVRATKLGPSGIFDADGNSIATMPYGEEGTLVADIQIPVK